MSDFGVVPERFNVAIRGYSRSQVDALRAAADASEITGGEGR
jgi:hypothetical protein